MSHSNFHDFHDVQILFEEKTFALCGTTGCRASSSTRPALRACCTSNVAQHSPSRWLPSLSTTCCHWCSIRIHLHWSINDTQSRSGSGSGSSPLCAYERNLRANHASSSCYFRSKPIHAISRSPTRSSGGCEPLFFPTSCCAYSCHDGSRGSSFDCTYFQCCCLRATKPSPFDFRAIRPARRRWRWCGRRCRRKRQILSGLQLRRESPRLLSIRRGPTSHLESNRRRL